MNYLQNHIKILIHLRGLPYQNRQTNAILKGLLGGVVKVFEPKVEDLLLWLLILLTVNPKPLDQGNVANGRLKIPVWGLESEHAFACLKKKHENIDSAFTKSLLFPYRYGFAVVLCQN